MTLTQVTDDLVRFRKTIADALDFIAQIETPSQGREAYDRVRLAKEWAKMQGLLADSRADLLRLEVHCLRRIAHIGATDDVLHGEMRGHARYFAAMSDAEIDAIIQEFGAESAGARTLARKAQGREDYQRGYAYATSGAMQAEQQYEGDTLTQGALRAFEGGLAAALVTLIEQYEDLHEPFDIAGMADDLFGMIRTNGEHEALGQREGLHALCRKAVLDAPQRLIGDSKAPAFITCHDRSPNSDGSWIRVPFSVATLPQLEDMVMLRREQAETAKRAADRLEDVFNDLSEAAKRLKYASITPLGEVAMQMAATSKKVAS